MSGGYGSGHVKLSKGDSHWGIPALGSQGDIWARGQGQDGLGLGPPLVGHLADVHIQVVVEGADDCLRSLSSPCLPYKLTFLTVHEVWFSPSVDILCSELPNS